MNFLMRWAARRNGGLALLFEKYTAPLERAGMAAVRARLAGGLRGRVIEIGCGTGLNFPHYPADTEVIAIEPMEEYRLFAADRARTVRARITVQEGDAQALPFPDHSFDAGFETLAFCSVPNALQGLRELRRVVKPGAPVLLFEHVRSEHPAVAMFQDLANPLWRYVTDGCNLNRDTVAIIRAAGLTIDAVTVHDLRVPHTPPFPMREIQARA